MNRRSLIKNGATIAVACTSTKFLIGCNTFNGSLNSISPIYIKKHWHIDTGPLELQFTQRIFVSSRFFFQLGFSEIGIDNPDSSNFGKKTNLRTADADFVAFLGKGWGRRATGNEEKPNFLVDVPEAEIRELEMKNQIFYHFDQPGTVIPVLLEIENLSSDLGIVPSVIRLNQRTQGGIGAVETKMPSRILTRNPGLLRPGLYRFTISTPKPILLPPRIEVFFLMSEVTA